MSTTTFDRGSALPWQSRHSAGPPGALARFVGRMIAAQQARVSRQAFEQLAFLGDEDLARLGYSAAQIRALRSRVAARPATWI
jgi:hypothetical protein